MFVSRWDKAVASKVPPDLRNRLGIAVAQQTYRAYRELLASARWRALAAAGAAPQRMLWASTGTKDPDASPTLYVEALAAPGTVDTMPEKTLLAFAQMGQVGAAMAADGGDMRRCWRDLPPPVLTSMHWRKSFKKKGRNPSSNRGLSSCKVSPRKVRRSPHRERPP